MSTAVWTVFAVAAMLITFAACIAAVVAGIRVLERLRLKGQRKEVA